jgi:hypothetical protein
MSDEETTGETGQEISEAEFAEATAAADLPEIQEAAQAVSIRLLVLDQQIAKAKAAYNAACTVAYPIFARLRNADIPQVAPDLGQGRAGLFSLLAGGKTIAYDEPELMLLMAVNAPSDLEDYIVPAGVTDDRVVKLVAGHFPDMVECRIKKAVRAELEKEAEKRNGWVPTPGTGELAKVAEVTEHDANGRFQLRPDTRAQQMIAAAVEAGVITEDGVLVTPLNPAERTAE